MEAIDWNILFEETDELQMGHCDGCGAPVDLAGGFPEPGMAVWCRECSESGVFPA